MKKAYPLCRLTLALALAACLSSTSLAERAPAYRPWIDLGELFHDVQMSGIFSDSKTFVDCIPRSSLADVVAAYRRMKDLDAFDLRHFVEVNFTLPATPNDVNFRVERPFFDHLNGHWSYLVRAAEHAEQYSTLVPMPNEYVVPGGRFREVYYWDSYFTMIGLAVSGRIDLIASMLDNFAFLIDTFGFIPNGNRTYYEGRSQPPFFSSMVNLYAQLTSVENGLKYLPAVQKEYDFWMDGQDGLSEDRASHRRVVLYAGALLNRYWDDYDLPRPESHKEDVELGRNLTEQGKRRLYRELRAGAESGWDYSSRWFSEPDDFASIRTTSILPVDLNSLMFATESALSTMYQAAGNEPAHRAYLKKSQMRLAAINTLFWNADAGMYQDILWQEGRFTGRVTAASFYPLYFRAARQDQVRIQTPALMKALLDDGGILTSTHATGQQWDNPNGWPPLQWIAVKGLLHYGFAEESEEIERRWLDVNRSVFSRTGKMMEKYNVSDTTLVAGGGEYPAQDGFGWTNGVALGLLADVAVY